MRISDWSSDVCSSNLVSRLSPRSRAMTALRSPSSTRRCSSATISSERERFRPRRSEEHTSELQSLMRISYAVFCLKKKNKTNHIRKLNTTNLKMNQKKKTDTTLTNQKGAKTKQYAHNDRT